MQGKNAGHPLSVMARKYRAHMFIFLLSLVILGVATSSRLYAWTGDRAAPLPPIWQQSGLSGMTVHFLALGHQHPDLALAATEGGVYGRDAHHPWHLLLAAHTVWAISLAEDDRTIVSGAQSGDVAVSLDTGRYWRRHLVTPHGVYAVTTEPGAARHILAGAGGGIYLSRDSGRHWQRRLSLPGSAGAAFAWQPGSNRIVFAGAVAGRAGGSTSVYVSRDSGSTWHAFGRHLHSRGGIMSLGLMGSRAVLAGTMGVAAWKAPLASGAWRQVANGMPRTEDHVAGIAVLPGRPGSVFVGTLGQGVFRTDDGGGHWTAVSNGLPNDGGNVIVLSLAYDSARHMLYAGTISGVYTMAVPRPA